MKKLILASSLLFVLSPYAVAEQCKSCNFTSGDLMAFLVLLALICLACAFMVAAVVFYVLNRIQPVQRKNVGISFCGAIAGGALGVIANFSHIAHSGHSGMLIYAFFCVFVGSVIGYFLSPKKKVVIKEETKPDDASVN